MSPPMIRRWPENVWSTSLLVFQVTHFFLNDHRYGLQHGAAFGLSHGLDQLAAFRPAPKDSRVDGLYFSGASTRPGNGVPLVMIGAGLTTERILSDLDLGSRISPVYK